MVSCSTEAVSVCEKKSHVCMSVRDLFTFTDHTAPKAKNHLQLMKRKAKGPRGSMGKITLLCDTNENWWKETVTPALLNACIWEYLTYVVLSATTRSLCYLKNGVHTTHADRIVQLAEAAKEPLLLSCTFFYYIFNMHAALLGILVLCSN
jgi:hypothetical protein